MALDLTDEERAWLAAFASGRSVTVVARDALLSERAMFRRLDAIYARLGVPGRCGAVALAAHEGVIRPGVDGQWEAVPSG